MFLVQASSNEVVHIDQSRSSIAEHGWSCRRRRQAGLEQLTAAFACHLIFSALSFRVRLSTVSSLFLRILSQRLNPPLLIATDAAGAATATAQPDPGITFASTELHQPNTPLVSPCHSSATTTTNPPHAKTPRTPNPPSSTTVRARRPNPPHRPSSRIAARKIKTRTSRRGDSRLRRKKARAAAW